MAFSIFVFIGPSASGKTRLQQTLGLSKIVTTTTRPMRQGEVEGKDYYFVTEETFLELKAQGHFLEMTEYAGSYYGTSQSAVASALKTGKTHGLVLDISGAQMLKSKWPDCVFIVGVLASRETVLKRLEARGEPDALKRMANYEAELQGVLELSDLIYPSDAKRDSAQSEQIEKALQLMISQLNG